MDVDYVAWQADHDAYGFSGQKLASTFLKGWMMMDVLWGPAARKMFRLKTWLRKCSAQSMLFMHEILGMTWPRYESINILGLSHLFLILSL